MDGFVKRGAGGLLQDWLVVTDLSSGSDARPDPDLQGFRERLSVAVYDRAGGQLWRLALSEEENAVALLSDLSPADDLCFGVRTELEAFLARGPLHPRLGLRERSPELLIDRADGELLRLNLAAPFDFERRARFLGRPIEQRVHEIVIVLGLHILDLEARPAG